MAAAPDHDPRVVEQMLLDQLGRGRMLVLRPNIEVDAAVLQPGLERRIPAFDQ